MLSLKVKLCIEAIIITWPPKDCTPLCAIKCIEIVHNVYNDLKGNFVVKNKRIWSQLVIFTFYTFVQDEEKLRCGWMKQLSRLNGKSLALRLKRHQRRTGLNERRTTNQSYRNIPKVTIEIESTTWSWCRLRLDCTAMKNDCACRDLARERLGIKKR